MEISIINNTIYISMTIELPQLRFVIYARKSSESEDRQVLSIDSQLGELEQAAAREGRHVIDIKTEAHSAKKPGRPVFNALLDAIEAGAADGLIVWNPDRLSRNSVDTGRLIYLFDLGKLKEVVTPTQVFRNIPSDKFLLNLLCSQAKLENDNKGLNVKRGLHKKAQLGVYPCPAPLGYANDKYGEKGTKIIQPDPERWHLVRKLFDLLLSGKYHVPEILRIANREWGFRTPTGKKLARSTLYRLFTQTVYYGHFEYPLGSGSWYKGVHKPMITAEEYDRIQVLLGRKGKPRPKRHVFDFTGLIRCGECGAAVTAEEKIKRQKNGNVHRYVYYHCTKRVVPNCSQRSLEEKDLEAQALTAIDSLAIMPEFHAFALNWFEKRHSEEAGKRHALLANYQKAYEQCVQTLDGLIDMRARGELTEEEFVRKKSAAMKEKLRLEDRLAAVSDQQNRWLEVAEDLLRFLGSAREKFTRDRSVRRAILSTLGSNLLLKDQKLTIDLEKALVPMKVAANEARLIYSRFEPLKNGGSKQKLLATLAKSPVMLSALDDVRTCLIQNPDGIRTKFEPLFKLILEKNDSL